MKSSGNVGGLRVAYSRRPSVFLATNDLPVWRHAVLLGAVNYVRSTRGLRVGVTDDPHGVWNAMKVPVMACRTPVVLPEPDEVVVRTVHRELVAQVERVAVAQGLTDEMVQAARRETMPPTAAFALFWYGVAQLIGSFGEAMARVFQDMRWTTPIWTVPYPQDKRLLREQPDGPFVVFEQGIDLEPWKPLHAAGAALLEESDPNRFFLLCRHRMCLCAVTRGQDFSVLAVASGVPLMQYSALPMYLNVPERQVVDGAPSDVQLASVLRLLEERSS